MKVFKLNAANGVPFKVVLLAAGDGYGRPGSDLVAAEPMVEFYDMRYPHDPQHGGQFVVRYYAKTLLCGEPLAGLDLHGGVPAWKLSQADMVMVHAFLAGADQEPPSTALLDFVVRKAGAAVAAFMLPSDAVAFVARRAASHPGQSYEVCNADGTSVSPQLDAVVARAGRVDPPLGFLLQVYELAGGRVVHEEFARCEPKLVGPSAAVKGLATRVQPVWAR